MSPRAGDGARSRREFPRAPLILSLVLGAAAGLGGYTFSYAKGLSYFRTAPEACVNCHIMQPQYDAWQKSSHHAVAVCVDCHLPEAFVPKYLAKAENGWRHGKLFTTRGFDEPIRLHPTGERILQDNCVRCHSGLVSMTHGSAIERRAADPHGGLGGDLPCVHCHATAGHGERAGLGGPLDRDYAESGLGD